MVMKLFNIKLLALMGVLSIGSNICAYMFSFNNLTSKTIDIRLGLIAADGWWHNTVQPLSKTEFVMGGWWAGYCMWGFDWKVQRVANAPIKTAALQPGKEHTFVYEGCLAKAHLTEQKFGAREAAFLDFPFGLCNKTASYDIVELKGRTDDSNVNAPKVPGMLILTPAPVNANNAAVGFQLTIKNTTDRTVTVDLFKREPSGASQDQWKEAKPVYLPVEVYNDAVKNAARIGTGFDTFLCTAVAAIKIVNKGQCPSMFSAIINWIGGLIARGSCANREFEILEDSKGNIEFFTYLH